MPLENITVSARVFTIDALACMLTGIMYLLVVEIHILIGVTHYDLHAVTFLV
jgi:hypothetical protein